MGFSGGGGGGLSLPINVPGGQVLAKSNPAGSMDVGDANTGNLNLVCTNLVSIGQGGDTFLSRQGAGVLLIGATLRTQAAQQAAAATAGAGAAPPATVQGYITFQDSTGTIRKIPYYAN